MNGVLPAKERDDTTYSNQKDNQPLILSSSSLRQSRSLRSLQEEKAQSRVMYEGETLAARERRWNKMMMG